MTTGTTALQTVKQPALINIGARALSTRGFRHDILEEHLKDHLGKPLNKQWCEIGCLARAFWGRNTQASREAMRKRLPGAFREFLGRNLFLVIEYAEHAHGHHGEALAVKLYRKGEQGLERQHALEQVEKWHRRRQISDETLQRAQLLLDFEPLVAQDAPQT